MPDTFIKIASVTVDGSAPVNIDFTSIPSTYTDLCLKLSLRTNRATVTDNTTIRFNLDTGTNYSIIRLRGDGISASSTIASAQTGLSTIAAINGSSGTASLFSNQDVYIPNYASANYKSVSMDFVAEENTTTAYSFLNAGLWLSTSAITSIRISSVSTFVQYSTATLYGIKKS